MFFESLNEVPKIAARCGTAIFVVPKTAEIEIKGAFMLSPEKKSVISIEQVREMMAKLNTKQTSDVFVIIRPAESLSLAAANALLKNLEEPGDKMHYVLVTDEPSQIIPTIMSRAAIYIMRTDNNVENDLIADDKVKTLAKKLLVAKGPELVDLADEITKKKDGTRNFALEVLRTAIEMLYKTYFITNKDVFLKKIPMFLKAYEGVARNGHIRLQIVSNLC